MRTKRGALTTALDPKLSLGWSPNRTIKGDLDSTAGSYHRPSPPCPLAHSTVDVPDVIVAIHVAQCALHCAGPVLRVADQKYGPGRVGRDLPETSVQLARWQQSRTRCHTVVVLMRLANVESQSQRPPARGHLRG